MKTGFKVSKHRLAQFLTDGLLICLSIYLAYAISEKSLYMPKAYLFWFIKLTALVLLLRITFIHYFGISRQLWRYVSIEDIIDIFKAVSVSSLSLLTVIFIFERSFLNKFMFIIDWFLCICLLTAARVIRRYFTRKILKERVSRYLKKKRVLLYGAGSAGDLFIREIMDDPYSKLLPVGIIDDDLEKNGARLHGVKILGTGRDLLRAIDRNNIEELIITISNVKQQTVDKIIRSVKRRNVNVRIMPSIYEALTDTKKFSNIREVDIDDLLGRDEVAIDLSFLEEKIKGKRFMVTGGAGSIGKELLRQLAAFAPEKLTALDINENGLFWLDYELSSLNTEKRYRSYICNIRDAQKLRKIIDDEKPEIIFHAAAYKHVAISEGNPSEYILTNILGTRNLLEIAANSDFIKKLCLISTDKAVNPGNIMGATKRVGEILINREQKPYKNKFFYVRFGNVLGSRGSVIPVFKDMIKRGGPIKITDRDVERFFMSIQEAVNLVLQSTFMDAEYFAFLLDMGKAVKITDLAKSLIYLSGLRESDIPIIYTGLRPGEKLKEELYNSSFEVLKHTRNRKILALRGACPEKIDSVWISNVIKHAQEDNNKKIKEIFNDIFPRLEAKM